MAELQADAGALPSEDREQHERLHTLPDTGEGHWHPNPQLKSLLDELKRHQKPAKQEDDGPEAA